MRPPPDLDKSILHDFLCFHFIDEHSDEKRIDQPAAAAIECRETALITLGDHRQQPGVLARFQRKQIAGCIRPRRLVFNRFHAPMVSQSCRRMYIRHWVDFGCKNLSPGEMWDAETVGGRAWRIFYQRNS